MAKTSLNCQQLGDFELSYDLFSAGVNFYSGDVVILHGWGAKKELMKPFVKIFSEAEFLESAATNVRIFSIDLPGFGASSEPPHAFSYKNYAAVIAQFCKAKELNKPLIIAHSFGCKIAAELAAQDLVSALILAGAAGVPRKKSLSVRAKIILAKCLKSLGIGKFLRAKDAANLSAVMYESFKIAVNDDARASYYAVNAPVLLLAGKDDTATPLDTATELSQNMPNAELAEFKGGHFFFLEPENQPLISAKIIEFLKLNKR